MNLTATDASIAALGGTCPGSDITARPVTARKAGPVALNLAGVIEGRPGDIPARSDLGPSSILSGGVEADPNSRNCFGNASNPLVVSGHAQRMTNTSLKTAVNIAGVAPRPLNFFNVPVLDEVFAESRLGNPDERVSVEKRGRAIATGSLSCSQTVAALKNFCQSVAKTPMKVGEPWATIGRAAKNMASEPDACAGVGSPRQGTLTITGSNVRLGTEMPVALSSLSL